LDDARRHCEAMVSALPAPVRRLSADATYSVSRSEALDTQLLQL
jgi:hypothetical protein